MDRKKIVAALLCAAVFFGALYAFGPMFLAWEHVALVELLTVAAASTFAAVCALTATLKKSLSKKGIIIVFLSALAV
nr:hypothetical protein [Clostridiales bacterium]